VKFWWLSFLDASRPKGSRFLGGCVVDVAPGGNLLAAALRAHKLGCNPGGECLGQPIPSQHARMIQAHDVGRLMDRAESESFGARFLS
jgi:hypothetical protein